jgi:hypothetical protein
LLSKIPDFLQENLVYMIPNCITIDLVEGIVASLSLKKAAYTILELTVIVSWIETYKHQPS